ncbi:MAG: hypothetical protein Q7U35_03385 [Methanobacteriaceae archaeon]|nr:hypothetical protein [Methanobacteriaceae archaeon]
MTVRVDKQLFEMAKKRGIRPQPAAELGLKILTHLSNEEIEVIHGLLKERLEETNKLMERMNHVAPEDLTAESNDNIKNVVIRMLYREYKSTLEFPYESIERAAAQKGISAEELEKDLYTMIWGSENEHKRRRIESPITESGH